MIGPKQVSIKKMQIFLIFLFIILLNGMGCTYFKSYSKMGEKPSPVDINTCPEYAKLVIENKNFDSIYLCKEERKIINNSEVILVELILDFGDCPSGCIPFRHWSVVSKGKTEIMQLPELGGNKGPAYYTYSKIIDGKSYFKDLPLLNKAVSIPDFTQDAIVDVQKRYGYYGWEISSPKYLDTYNVFVFLRNQSESLPPKYIWDFSNIPIRLSVDSAISSLNESTTICNGYEVFQNETVKIEKEKLFDGSVMFVYTIPIKCPDGALNYATVAVGGLMHYGRKKLTSYYEKP